MLVLDMKFGSWIMCHLLIVDRLHYCWSYYIVRFVRFNASSSSGDHHRLQTLVLVSCRSRVTRTCCGRVLAQERRTSKPALRQDSRHPLACPDLLVLYSADSNCSPETGTRLRHRLSLANRTDGRRRSHLWTSSLLFRRPLPNRGSRRPASVDPLCPVSHICANYVLLLLGAGKVTCLTRPAPVWKPMADKGVVCSRLDPACWQSPFIQLQLLTSVCFTIVDVFLLFSLLSSTKLLLLCMFVNTYSGSVSV